MQNNTAVADIGHMTQVNEGQEASQQAQSPLQLQSVPAVAPTAPPPRPKPVPWKPATRKRKKVVKPHAAPPLKVKEEGAGAVAGARAGAGTGNRKESWVWEHFTRRMDGDDFRASCDYCGADYAAHPKLHGTGNLINHLHNQCKKYENKPVDEKQKQLIYANGEEGVGASLKNMSYSSEECRKKLAEMVIRDEYAFRCVEGEGFRAFTKALQPRFKLPGRVTVARDVMKIFEDEKEKLKKLIKSQRVCLTTDAWTSIQNKNYMCLTAHWIDCEWRLQKRILSFCVTADHKGHTIGKMIEGCMLDWGIDNLLTITVDNASSNDGAIKYLKKNTLDWKTTVLGHEFLHLRCSAHILNLIVKDGLKNQNDSIIKIRNAVRYVRSSPHRLDSFKVAAAKQKIDSKSLVCLDVETRWNSTYLMLEAAIKFEKAFERLGEEDANYRMFFVKGDKDIDGAEGSDAEDGVNESGKKKATKNTGPPTEEDWDVARSFLKFLKLFYDVTKTFSGTLHATSNMFFRELVSIINSLNCLGKEKDLNVSIMATSMKKKFSKYWESLDKLNILLFVATILDPRFKMKFITFGLSQVYEKSSKMPSLLEDKARDVLNCLFEYYQSLNPCETDSNLSANQTPMDVDMNENNVDLVAQFTKQLEEDECGKNQSEIAKYLAESCEKNVKSFDVLKWWRDNSNRFPILSQVAKDILAIHVSTVASESAFGTSGRILDPFRSSLNPELVEALVCCQNWLRSTSIMIDIQESMKHVPPSELEEYDDVLKDFRRLNLSSYKS